MTRYAMVADLDRCVGCQTCTAACRHHNATSPAVQWRRVLDVEAGSYPEVSRTFVPVGCQHCEDPPCMHVCPTTATRKRADGIVTVDYDLCIGCAYCEVACPYQARFKIDQPGFAYGPKIPSEKVDEKRIGVSQKCTFCSDRIDYGLANGLVPGVDADATPACVNSCIADALHFGDVEDADSNISKLLQKSTSFRMHEELGTKPGFYYLHDKRGATSATPVRGEGIEPKHQQHWDWKAAMNFLLGGSGAALFGLSFIYSLFVPAIIALVLMASGLGILLFKIGRPLRFLYVLRQPLRSWMAREAWLAGLFFPLAIWHLAAPHEFVGVVAGTAALCFLIAQAMILKESKGVPAWRTTRVVPLIILTGLAEGAGLFAVFMPLPLVLATLVVLRGVAWYAYMKSLDAPRRSLEVLNGYRPFMLWLGLVLPLVLIAYGFTFNSEVAYVLAGLATVASGWALKFILVTRAGYQQGFALQRGATTIKPGWGPA
jgi:phenylacetyl-CoA:acceptor oxidoreductase subunit 1